MVMFGSLPAADIFGVRMQAAQSSVGNVLSNIAMWPPMLGFFSTRKTFLPVAESLSAASMPAMPPPTTMHGRVDRHLDGVQRLVERQAMDLRAQDALGLLGGLVLVLGDPGAVLAHVGHLEQERVEAGVGRGLAERGLVHGRRAGRHDDAVHAELLDVFFDQVLAGIRAHVLVLARDHHVGLLGSPGGDLLDVDLAADVAAAVAEVDGDLLVSHVRLLRAHAGIAATTRSQETICLSMASCVGSAPNARPASCVKYITGMSKLVPKVLLTRGW